MGFMPVPSSGGVQRPGVGSIQPPSPPQVQPVQPAAAPPAPPPTLQTADTSKVPGNCFVVSRNLTLTKLNLNFPVLILQLGN